jgi:hypothetical protein
MRAHGLGNDSIIIYLHLPNKGLYFNLKLRNSLMNQMRFRDNVSLGEFFLLYFGIDNAFTPLTQKFQNFNLPEYAE